MNPKLSRSLRDRNRLLILIATLLIALVAWVGIVLIQRIGAEVTDAPTTAIMATYVNEDVCATCHEQAATAWRNSHHARAMQPATDETVLGDFADATFTAFAVTTRFFRRGDEFWVNTVGSEGKAADFQVAYTFGVDPLQQYLLALPNGRYQALTLAWDPKQARWFDLYPEAAVPITDTLHWTRRHFTWNSSCAECHSTDLQLNYDLKTDHYATSWAEIHVGCQACHGAGSEHVAWAQAAGDQGTVAQNAMGLVVPPDKVTSRFQVEVCAPCHARRYAISPTDVVGEPLLDHFMPALLTADRYYADGQILDEVFEYGSFVQSKMYKQGVVCTDCHEGHTLVLQAPENALCVRCHQPNPPTARFPTLQAKAYATPAHHFHEADSPGARCVNCHMPTRNYMVVDPRHDHSLRIPRPDLSEQIGTPNACTGCHTDQAPAWATAQMTAWYGTSWQRPHYGTVLAAGRTGAADAAPALIQLATDQSQSALVRATALDLLPAYGSVGMAAFQKSLTDPDPLVRTVAIRSLAEVANQAQLTQLTPFLTDAVRAVRIEAAAALATLPADTLAATTQPQLTAALAEYQSAQLVQADHPEGYLNLGLLYARQGKTAQADDALQSAIQRDPLFFPAYNTLANFYYQQGRPADAEKVFRQGVAALPDQGELAYGLGLVLVEQQRLPEALTYLAHAARQLPSDARVLYNYGLLLQQTGQAAQAETALQQANRVAPQDSDILYALVAFYAQQQAWDTALPYAEALTTHYPTVAQFKQLLTTVKANAEQSN